MKIRADLLLVKNNLAASRTEAQALIMAGQVYCAKGRVEKSSDSFLEEDVLEVKAFLPFVSRGGVKLDHALKEFGVDVSGKICLDIGASTGGFTDCLLQGGAQKVYAIDVGYGQFHWKLRKHPQVVLYEKVNFRHMEREKVPDIIDLVVIDVSFISLTHILPRVRDFLKDKGEVVALVKPQFELSPSEVNKGIVRSDDLREKAISKIDQSARELGFKVLARTTSPILGAKGNQEYFLHLLWSQSMPV